MKTIYTISLLTLSNVFMTFAWYGHLQFQKIDWLKALGIVGMIAISWFIALFEYMFQVPANRIGYNGNGGPFDMFELKTLQEAISITVFIIINIFVFKGGQLQWNHVVGFLMIIAAVYIIFRKW
jgi:uncharacterized protein (DUF486 family)